MKKLVVLLLVCLTPSAARATLNPCPDILGVYFDESADLDCQSASPYVPFTAYVVVTNPTGDLIRSAEFGYRIEGALLFVGATLPPGAFNVGDSSNPFVGDYILGFPTPLPGGGQNVTLVTWTFLYSDINGFAVEFFLGESTPATIGNGFPAYVTGQDIVQPLGYASGGELVPVATANGDCRAPVTVVINADPDGLNQPWHLDVPGSPNGYAGAGDATLTGLPSGDYTLNWGDVAGHAAPTPNPVGQFAAEGGAIVFDGVYEPSTTAIDDVQAYFSDGTPNSPYAGLTVALQGTVFVTAGTYNPGTHYILDETGGIAFFNNALPFALQVGDVVRIFGPVSSFAGEIELQMPEVQLLSSGPEPAPRDMTPDEVLADYENVGLFARVSGTVVAKATNQFELQTNGPGNLVVYVDPDTGIDVGGVTVGNEYSVRGAVVNYNGLIEIKPRFPADLRERPVWPSASAWVPLADPATGELLIDAEADGVQPAFDLFGTAADPLAFFAADDSSYFYRIRLAESPLLGTGKFQSMVAKILFEFDFPQGSRSHDFAIVFNGTDEQVTLERNLAEDADWCADAPEWISRYYPAGPDLFGHARVVAAGPVLEGFSTWFLDIQVPIADVQADLRLPLQSASQIVIVTSTNPSQINRDTANLDCGQAWSAAVAGVPGVEGPSWSLHQNAPNPFNPQTTIAFEVPGMTAVNLQVFDLSGGLVRTLRDGEILARGRHEAVWNGRDDSGRPVASGSYFYRLEAAGFSETKRMVLVK